MAMDILGSSGEMISTLLSNGSSTVVWHYSWGDITKCLPIQDTDLITYKVWISSKIQFSETMSFTEITYKRKIGLKMAISPKPTQHGLQIIKAQGLEHIGASGGSSTGGKVSFKAVQLGQTSSG